MTEENPYKVMADMFSHKELLVLILLEIRKLNDET
jgi:hypothetical protein